MAEKTPTSNAEEMTYETVRAPNVANERARLAAESRGLTKAELLERAKPLGIDVGGAPTRDELVERVQDARV